MAEIFKQLFFSNRIEWRTWLEENHYKDKEIWLIYFKKHTNKPSITYEEAVQESLCFGWIDSILKRIDDEKYMQKFTPRKSKSIWSETNKRRVEKLIEEGIMTEAGLVRINEAKENGEWYKSAIKDETTEIPPDLSKALDIDKMGLKNFTNFAPSYQKLAIGWISSAKKDETRQKRIIEIVELAIDNKKLGMK